MGPNICSLLGYPDSRNRETFACGIQGWGLSIQQKFRFEISEILLAQWNGTFWLHRPDPSHRAFGDCSCKQDTTGRKWKGTFQSDRPKWPDRSKWISFKASLEYSGRTKPKWSVPFDVPTEISGILGWMQSAPEFNPRNPKSSLRMETRIQVPLTKQSKEWNSESKTVLDYFTYGDKYELTVYNLQRNIKQKFTIPFHFWKSTCCWDLIHKN